MQRGVGTEIAGDHRINAMKLAFDSAFAGFFAKRQHHFAVAALQACFKIAQSACEQPAG